MINKGFSQEIITFHGRLAPEKGNIVGYGALINALQLHLPYPNKLSLISEKRRQYKNSEWRVLTSRHMPADTLYGHLVFALKYEGINLLFFKKLFEKIGPQITLSIIQEERISQYSRKISK